MEDYLEPDNEGLKNIEIDRIIENISLAMIDEDITDDNPSYSNNLTTLDQLIIFELKDHISKELPVYVIKDRIKLKVWELENEDEYEKVGKDSLYKDEDRGFDLNKPHAKEVLWRIAKHILANNITTDNPSPSNGYNSMEQIVGYKFYDYCYSEKDFVKIGETLETYISTLEGGSDISDFYINSDYLYKKFL